MSYPEHSLGESYHFAEMQTVYSIVQADWASRRTKINNQWRKHGASVLRSSRFISNNVYPSYSMININYVEAWQMSSMDVFL